MNRLLFSSKRIFSFLVMVCFLFSVIGFGRAAVHAADVDYIIYGDALHTEWENWSWGTTMSFTNTEHLAASQAGILATYDSAWAGIYLHTHNAIDTVEYASLTFSLYSDVAQSVNVTLIDETGNGTGSLLVATEAGNRINVTVPFLEVGAPRWLSGIMIQEGSGNSGWSIYLDDIALKASGNVVDPNVPVSSVNLTINTRSAVRKIDPKIYGVNFADEALATELAMPLNRWGGNAVTRYNWKLDVSNRGSDWYFENIPNDTLPATGKNALDMFIQDNINRKTESLVTMPMIGWTPKSRDISCAFSINVYGTQTSSDPWRNDCGSGYDVNNQPISGNSPTDTSIAIDEAYVTEWIGHLKTTFGSADQGGVRYYALDNEPFLWNHTHRDVHPEPATYDEVRDLTYRYGAAIKSAEPNAQVLGPVLWGWTAYFYSALDAASGDWNNPPDYTAHGKMPFLAWYLQQMAQYEATHNTRILDYADIHYYPQQANVALTSAGNLATQALRLRSTRALWDTTYVDESWINESVQLIPRMKGWIDSYYPDTKLSISEYNWGGLEHINGALAQADILGIFGREGVDMAMLWDAPKSNQPGAFAFRMYRNYDGNGSQFGDVSVSAASEDQSQLSVYAARRSADETITIMVINKAMATMEGKIATDIYSPNVTAQAYRYSGANLDAIEKLVDQPLDNLGAFDAIFPANSITLYTISNEQLRLADQPTSVHYAYLPIMLESGSVEVTIWSGLTTLSLATVAIFMKKSHE